MQSKCEYCGAYISDGEEKCKQCGAVNANFKRTIDGTPKTIEELKAWYMQKNLPPQETTRFFIGENYTGARAFGIYEENGEYIVYKNKDDGSRAVRYKGRDEAYAVNELYLKLKSEILNQKAHNLNNKKANENSKSSKISDFFSTVLGWIIIIFVIGGIIGSVVAAIVGAVNKVRDLPYAGKYYTYNDDVYYCESYVYDDWYVYDYNDQDYLPVEIPQDMYDDIQSYRFSKDEVWDSGIEVFEDTDMGQYVESLKESSDSDSDWSSSDSWDSDSTDWGSDW